MEEFTKQNRGGKGVKCYKITEKTGNVVGMKAVDEESEIMIINTEGIVIRMKCSRYFSIWKNNIRSKID